ncbi:hypothetical protein SORBI_3010G112401 [Sorghum bicolor]|uniref:Uncharacterized protein n=1 Tax=Sorghum bicolor TaxID=4558 RepID=A0A1W0VSF4_SORBI|nr:hypothetical protein SORBI_3010G112401 [Sorghum bicolor]
MEEGERIQSKTRTIVKHRGCCIEQTVMKTLSPSALDDNPRRRSKTVRVTPIHYEVVSGWIQPETPSATAGHHDHQIIQMYPEDNQKKALLTAASWDGGEEANRVGYDYCWVMEQVRAIEAAMSRDKKLLRELKNEVAELKREVQRYKEQLDAKQQMNKGKMILAMVAEVLPVPDSIRTTLSRLIDLI